MSQEEMVRKASGQFYAALNSMLTGDSGPLTAIWSHNSTATTMHPIGGREIGWDTIKGTFKNVSEIAANGRIRIADQVINVIGDCAYELGVEQGQADFGGKTVQIEQRVTNIYKREGNEWKIVHHHADLAPALKNAVADLMAKV